ncbi:MAG: hypothetical protein ACK55Z_32740, partial [bacterium]
VYYGSRTDRSDRLVKDICPPPSNKGVYYFTLDIDPGVGGGEASLQGVALISPADALCDSKTSQCTASTGPGYDLYASKTCLPGPGGPGLVTRSLPNAGYTTRKTLELETTSFQRFYIAVR